MSEKIATKRLRRMLDERGVEHQDHYLSTSWIAGGILHMASEQLDGTLVVDKLTPEQAIAATLGSGTLTAEQVREAIFDGSSYASYDGAKYYADGINMQAIADELNARAEMSYEDALILLDELGLSERTCEIYRVGNTQDLRKCSACDVLMSFGHPLDRCHLNYCPNCGARVVD